MTATADAAAPQGVDRRWVITGLVAVGVAIAAGLVASSGTVPGWEETAFHAINDLPDWLEAPMWVFQLAGLLLVLLWPVLPGRWRWLPVAIALLNAVARVYLGAHNPLDVVGGGAIGVALGSLLVIVFRFDDRSRH